MKESKEAMQILDVDHLGIVAGIIDEMELVEEVNKIVGIKTKETLTPGQVIKAMILNGLGFLSAPLYLFEEFFIGKATEHLIGEGVLPEHLNDDKLGRELDKYYQVGTTKIFTTIAIKAAHKFQVESKSIHLDGTSMSVEGEYKKETEEIEAEKIKAGRFILATNVLDKNELSNEQVLEEYKAQQSNERGFRFLKDPLFFTSSVFVKTPERVEAIAMIMGLCLLVYNLAQRKLRQELAKFDDGIRNQVNKITNKPTMRWVFQMFQAVHLVIINGQKQMSNLTEQRQKIVRYLGKSCSKYYLII